MSDPARDAVLVLNAGSSSLKAGIFRPESNALAGERALLSAEARGIGQPNSRFEVRDASGNVLRSSEQPIATQTDALNAVAEALRQHGEEHHLVAIGHRVVHGGPELREHTLLTPKVLATLRGAVHFAPLHLPASLALIGSAEAHFPGLPQVSCFDTAFHRTMPLLSRRLPIPAKYAAAGVERYGFHGLSYESLLAQLRRSTAGVPERVVLAHLGGGSSLCAMYRGESVDTTMGLTPAGGLVMTTRSGDLDPGVLLFLARNGSLDLDTLESLVNHHCGLSAVSNTSGDMQEIESAMHNQAASPEAREAAALAFEQFAVSTSKAIAGMIVTLGGLDLLVFAGGIGEHSAPVRGAVLRRLEPFGVRLDEQANAQNGRAIHGANSTVEVLVLPAEEDPVIAAHTRALIGPARHA